MNPSAHLEQHLDGTFAASQPPCYVILKLCSPIRRGDNKRKTTLFAAKHTERRMETFSKTKVSRVNYLFNLNS